MHTHIKPGIDARTVYKIKPRSWGSITMGLHITMTVATGNGTRAASLVDVRYFLQIQEIWSNNQHNLEKQQ